jgi:hypothetical protein
VVFPGAGCIARRTGTCRAHRSRAAQAPPATTTPIEHLIVVVVENLSLDNLFGIYEPRSGAAVHNLLSERIANADGSPGPDFAKAVPTDRQGAGQSGIVGKECLLVTTDESGGYWDSGYMQILDAFGDRTRISLIAVSPFAKIRHGRPHLYRPGFDPQIHPGELAPRPVIGEEPRPSAEPGRRPSDSYVPANRPTIGDLISLFQF